MNKTFKCAKLKPALLSKEGVGNLCSDILGPGLARTCPDSVNESMTIHHSFSLTGDDLSELPSPANCEKDSSETIKWSFNIFIF